MSDRVFASTPAAAWVEGGHEVLMGPLRRRVVGALYATESDGERALFFDGPNIIPLVIKVSDIRSAVTANHTLNVIVRIKTIEGATINIHGPRRRTKKVIAALGL